jgi:DNA-binding GntR family transcriptional regulator
MASPSLMPVAHDRQPLTESVYTQLADAICAGVLAPGEALVQERLAESLGVSRQPILQALAMLRRDGFVEPADKRGYRVSRLSPDMVADVYSLRGALDRLAAGAAARRVKAGAVTPAMLAQLDAALDQGEAALGRGDTALLIEADQAFHQAIYDLSGNQLIGESAAQPWRHIRRAMGAVLQNNTGRRGVWQEHRRIVTAIQKGDGEGAEREASAHADQAAARMGAGADPVPA